MPRYRPVYCYSADELTAIAIEAVAIGERSSLEVYLHTATRVGRDSSR